MDHTHVVSRRTLARWTGTGMAAAPLRPLLAATPARPADAIVRLSANENPYGPSPAALQAMREALALVWRYPDETVQDLAADLGALHGAPKDWFVVGDGSSEILKLAASAFTDAHRKLVMAEPSFEAIGKHAQVVGAEVVSVPLDRAYGHDLERMSVPGAGLVYLCNPNNPTGSITPKAKVRAFLDSLPPSTAVLVDEAYHHYADSPEYESVIPLIKSHPNLIVARTFSKIYGMAGLRCGYCVAQPEAMQRLRPHQTWDSVNIMAITAAIASLEDGDQVTNGQRLNRETKKFVTDELSGLGYAAIPSQANFIMVNVKREARPIIGALAQRGVQIGRPFPALPNHLRVTIGKRLEMETFLSAFRQVVA